jgi:hypothetical protein
MFSICRHFISIKKYKEVIQISKKTGRKILVIGDPCNGTYLKNILNFIVKPYGHGDVCIDLFGCDKCEKISINDFGELSKFKTNGYIVFESATFTYSKDIHKLMKEIIRISGGYFISVGGSYDILWNHIGSKLYDTTNCINYYLYPYDYRNDKIYKVYNRHTKKYEMIY